MESETIYLKRSRTVGKASNICHVYLPKELEGEEVVGVIIRRNESDKKYV